VIIPSACEAAGAPVPAVRLAVMDDEGHILPPHHPEKSLPEARSLHSAITSWPDATNEIRTFGWHHTGDIGYRDELGFFYIVDRKKT